MSKFKYIAKDFAGRTVNEVTEATDQASLVLSLRRKNLTVISIMSVKEKVKSRVFSYRKVKSEEVVIFARQLATMVEAGIPLVQSFDILSEQMESKQFSEVMKKIKDDLESGSNLSEAFGRHPGVFSALFVHMVRAGETSGTLGEILNRMATYLEKTEALRRKVKSALTYPAVVTCLAIAVTMVLLLRVIPVFEEIFSDFGANLPRPTMLLILISKLLRQYFLLFVLILVAAIFAVRSYGKTETGRLKIDRCLLRMPVFGVLFKKVAISKFSRTLSTLVRSGVPILSSLEIVEKTAGNRVIELAVVKARERVREGESIAPPLAESGVFPSMVVRMISIGETTGELEKMLAKVSDFYEEQVDATVSGLTSMIEPLIIAFLGVVIGSIVICMFMPIFKMSEIIAM